MEVPCFLRKILRIGGKMINFADEFINIIRYGRKNRTTHQASWKKQYKTMAMPLHPRHHHSNHYNMFSQRKYNKPNIADIRVIKKPYLVHLALLLCNALSCISSSLFFSWAEELPSMTNPSQHSVASHIPADIAPLWELSATCWRTPRCSTPR